MEVTVPQLIDETAAARALSLEISDMHWLVSTGQLTPLTIGGEHLYSWRQLEELVAVYYAQQTKR